MLSQFQLEHVEKVEQQPGFSHFCLDPRPNHADVSYRGPIAVTYYHNERLHVDRVGQNRVLRRISF